MVGLRRTGSEHENKVVTVLVVEDEAMMRTKLVEELEDAGYLVVEASDGTEAVDILTLRPDIKIVISDVRMPGPIDGVELCRRVRSGYPGIKTDRAPRGCDIVRNVKIRHAISPCASVV
jgi:CheY-like chemotaxis protein